MAQLLPDLAQRPLKEQIAQMIVVRASGYLFDHQIRYPQWEPPAATLQHWLQDLNVGGVILLGGSAAEISLRTRQLQSWAKTPLLIAADIEEGVGQRFTGATWFPPPMALEAIAQKDPQLAQHYAHQMGAITAQEAIAIGINWLLAPVVDVNNNPDNPVINVRAFASTSATVGQLASAFIAGAKPYRVLTTAKHFPGHGDTATDSHLALPVLPFSPARLAQIELPPFESAIAAGVDSIMSAHLLIRAWDKQFPATLSKAILTGQLRQRLGFGGLIVTDALIMGALAKVAPPAEIPVLAVEAGADILLMPDDPAGAIDVVYQAVQAGRIPPERIRASVERIEQAKQNLFPSQTGNFLAQLAQPSAMETATNMAAESLQSTGPLPLPTLTGTEAHRNLIVTDELLSCDFLDRHTPAVLFPQQLGYELQLLTPSLLAQMPARSEPKTLLQVFVRGNPFRGTAGLSPAAQAGLQRLLTSGTVQAMIVYGSPYLWKQLRLQIPKPFPLVFSYGQMPIAQAIACRTLFGLSSFPDYRNETFL